MVHQVKSELRMRPNKIVKYDMKDGPSFSKTICQSRDKKLLDRSQNLNDGTKD
ncbi:hypothetical protein HAX54_013136, partial [Datura stramonium]|nr:hypothetical protein [Datura stramonium]